MFKLTRTSILVLTTALFLCAVFFVLAQADATWPAAQGALDTGQRALLGGSFADRNN